MFFHTFFFSFLFLLFYLLGAASRSCLPNPATEKESNKLKIFFLIFPETFIYKLFIHIGRIVSFFSESSP